MEPHGGGEGELRELKLWKDKKEREVYDNSADLFAIIKTTEKLERMYVSDSIGDKEYEAACQKLISQYKTLCVALQDTVPDVLRFVNTYNMECPHAIARLVHSGMPATLQHGAARQETSSAASIAETVQYMITAMDSLKLNMCAVDQVYPLLSDVVAAQSKVLQLPPDFEGKVKIREWVTRLHQMPASHELSEDEQRQLMFDLESAYNQFTATLRDTT
mmetsp:Transcript_71627/g.226241  ORF Transcript_71627/g.226241 Transcript_71627/m.226241 type:complete len:218 (-) Transcript_71627:272-925(-)